MKGHIINHVAQCAFLNADHEMGQGVMKHQGNVQQENGATYNYMQVVLMSQAPKYILNI